MVTVSTVNSDDMRKYDLTGVLATIRGWKIRFVEPHEAPTLILEMVDFQWPPINGLANELPDALKPTPGENVAVLFPVVLEHTPGASPPVPDAQLERALLASINADPSLPIIQRFATRFILPSAA